MIKIISEEPVILSNIKINKDRWPIIGKLYDYTYETAKIIRSRNYIKNLVYYVVVPASVMSFVDFIKRKKP